MQTQQTPQVLQQPFAAQGDKNTIPNAATGTNKASLQEGFPPITGQPINQGGIPPERQDFNGIMNLNSQFYFAFQNGWLPTFSQDVSDAIGGYPQGAVLWYQTDNGLQILQSTIPNNTNNFITNPSVIGTSWVTVGATQAYVQQAIPNYFYTQISNCITKIPQDIKLTLVDGVLTLKAGSKVWYPNGKDEAGENVFASLTLAEDMSFGYGSILDNLFLMLSVDGSANWITPDTNSNITSGGTGPSQSNGRRFWYDTANNKIYCYAPNSDTPLQGTFPLAILKCTAENVFEIKQVFNGFGYIGQVLYALPGVEGLSPNGRNEDGSLKNELMVLDHVVVRDYTWSCTEGQYVFLGISQEYGDDFSLISTNSPRMYKQQSTPPDLDNYITWHSLDENKLYRTEHLSATPNWVSMRGFAIGPVFNTGDGTNVSAWNIANPVAALDMSNTSYMSKMGMPSGKKISLSIGASDSVYTAPANGYFCITAKASETTTAYIHSYDTPSYGGRIPMTTWQYVEGGAVVPIKAGQTVQIYYQSNVTIQEIRFVFAEGEK